MAGRSTVGDYIAKPITLVEPTKERSQWVDAARRFSRNRLAMFGLVVLFFLIFLAVFADVLALHPYDMPDFTRQANELPFIDPVHPLGLDNAGRDYLTRLIYGARTSMLVGLVVPLISFSIGLPLGAFSGYKGGKVDFV